MEMGLISEEGLRVSGPSPARLDYRILVATLQAWQLATATARAGTGGAPLHEPEPKQHAPLPEILLGRPDWQQAVLAQGGSFNPAFARGLEAG